MLTHDTPHNLFEENYAALRNPERSRTGTKVGAICGVIGLLVLMLMLLIATGTVPLYDWQA